MEMEGLLRGRQVERGFRFQRDSGVWLALTACRMELGILGRTIDSMPFMTKLFRPGCMVASMTISGK